MPTTTPSPIKAHPTRIRVPQEERDDPERLRSSIPESPGPFLSATLLATRPCLTDGFVE